MENNAPLNELNSTELGDALSPEAMEELSNGKGDDEDEQQQSY